MSNDSQDERPCLHCLIVDLIDEFHEEYGEEGGSGDMSEVITALAKVVAEITSGSDAAGGQHIVDELAREITKYDAEYRESAGTSGPGFDVRH